MAGGRQPGTRRAFYRKRQESRLTWQREGFVNLGGSCVGLQESLPVEPKSSVLVVIGQQIRRPKMHEIIYLVGLIVVIMFVLSLLGLR